MGHPLHAVGRQGTGQGIAAHAFPIPDEDHEAEEGLTAEAGPHRVRVRPAAVARKHQVADQADLQTRNRRGS